MTHYVYSTLANDQAYTTYHPRATENSPATIARKVVIKGGARVVPHKAHSSNALVMTSLTDDEFDFVSNHPVFQRHVNRGFITVRKDEAKEAKVLADMEARDNSSPKEASDFTDSETKPAGIDTKLKLKNKAA